MSYCKQCGTKLEEGQTFCPNCGARVGGANPEQPQMVSYYKGMPATGGLKVWLWIIIVCGIISTIYFFYQAYAVSAFGGIYVLETLASAVVMMVEIFGEYRLLKGFKNGFYIICACAGVGLIINLINSVSTGSAAVFIVGILSAAISLGIIWMLAKKQWEYFQ